MQHCASKVPGTAPKTTINAAELCASDEVDVVLVCSATPLHVSHAITALENDKHVLVEKPLALCYRDIDALAAAEAKSKGNVFVGYMRRYAPALQSAIKEIGDHEIQYARVRDLIGPNSHFVAQSGTFPQRHADISQRDMDELKGLEDNVAAQALEVEFKMDSASHWSSQFNMLGLLGTHDLSAMREVLGMPEKVIGAGFKGDYWTATFDFGKFLVVYESCFNDVPVFDAHIEVYTKGKIVRVNYDTPFVKGLPTTMTVREKLDQQEGLPLYQERHVRQTYEDSYTIELRQWYDCIVKGRRPKTSVEDARQDVDIINMILQAAAR